MYYNLLNQPEKLKRDVSVRLINKEKNKLNALKFGKEYFDGKRDEGYGGYVYDGRWIEVSKNIIKRYNVKDNAKFLDIGCAKGFLLSDMKDANPSFDVYGIDVSEYAKSFARTDIKEKITIASCEKLPYPDNFFDVCTAINTIHNLEIEGCKKAILEMIRVTKNKKNIFIQVDAYTDDEEKKLFEDWVLTAKTYLKPSQWEKLFKDTQFQGDFFWTIIGFFK